MVKVEFYQAGKEFRPKIFLPDLEEYERLEDEYFREGAKPPSKLIRLRADFVSKVLGRENGGEPLKLEADVTQIQNAFWSLWNHAFRREVAAPSTPEGAGESVDPLA